MKLKYDNWNKITLEVFDKLRGIDTSNLGDLVGNLDVNVKMVSILCDVDEDEVTALPISHFGKLVKDTLFLKEMPKYNINTTYKIGDREFEVKTNLRELTTAQFIDFQTFVKEGEKRLANLIAVFLLPKGAKGYGDGYDILELSEFIYKNMSIAVARSILFFFTLQYRILSKVLMDYSITQVKKSMKKETDMEKKMKMEQAIVQMTQARDLIGDMGGSL